MLTRMMGLLRVLLVLLEGRGCCRGETYLPGPFQNSVPYQKRCSKVPSLGLAWSIIWSNVPQPLKPASTARLLKLAACLLVWWSFFTPFIWLRGKVARALLASKAAAKMVNREDLIVLGDVDQGIGNKENVATSLRRGHYIELTPSPCGRDLAKSRFTNDLNLDGYLGSSCALTCVRLSQPGDQVAHLRRIL